MEESKTSNTEMPNFDHKLAQELVGITLLFGISYLCHSGELRQQAQHYGHIVAVDESVIKVELQSTKEIFTLPPFLNELQEAAQGEYKLRSTGQTVTNPDLIGSFQVFEAEKSPSS